MQAGDEVEGSHSECADSERWNLMVLSQPVHLTRGADGEFGTQLLCDSGSGSGKLLESCLWIVGG